jgi:hypothetical protein
MAICPEFRGKVNAMRHNDTYLVLDERKEPVSREPDDIWQCELRVLVHEEEVASSAPKIILRGRTENEIRALRYMIVESLHADGHAVLEEDRPGWSWDGKGQGAAT